MVAWYDFTVEREGKTITFTQSHMQSLMKKARDGDEYFKKRIARAAYMRWRRTPAGRRLDNGIAFTYDEMQIADRVTPSKSQLDIFEDQ